MRSVVVVPCLVLVLGVSLGSAGCRPDPARSPAEDWKFANPLLDAKVGEWATYRLSDENSFQLEVVEVGTATPMVRVQERTIGGEMGNVQDSGVKTLGKNHVMNGYQSAGWIVKAIYEDVVDVAGRRWNSLCIEYLTPRQGLVKVWYSQDVPVYGMLRQVGVRGSGQELTNAELEDWSGRSETGPGKGPGRSEK